MKIPNKAGTWRCEFFDDPVEVYPLEPVGGVLCIWGPDVGMSYTGATDTQEVWDTDEWQGHIPVFKLESEWEFLY